jgi:hypothetical protein
MRGLVINKLSHAPHFMATGDGKQRSSFHRCDHPGNPRDRRSTVKTTQVLMLAGLCALSLGVGTAMAQNESPSYLMLQQSDSGQRAGAQHQANTAQSNQVRAESSNVAHSE